MSFSNCKHCNKEFKVIPSYSNWRIRNGKPAPMFCSKRCFGLNKEINETELVDAVIELYKSGKGSVEIGKRFNLSDATIRNILKRNKIDRRNASERVKGSLNPLFGKGHSTETKKRMSVMKSEFYDNNPHLIKGIREKTLNQIASGEMPKANTSIEKKMMAILGEIQCEFVYQKIYAYWAYDFFIPSKNIFIECDGDYWHGNPDKNKTLNKTQINNIARGKQKQSYAEKRGYKVLRFWECDINNRKEFVKESIIATL